MKIKTKISLEAELFQEANHFIAANGHNSLSELIEELLGNFLATKRQVDNDLQELEAINREADRLNDEAMDVLSYQVDLGNAAISIGPLPHDKLIQLNIALKKAPALI